MMNRGSRHRIKPLAFFLGLSTTTTILSLCFCHLSLASLLASLRVYFAVQNGVAIQRGRRETGGVFRFRLWTFPRSKTPQIPPRIFLPFSMRTTSETIERTNESDDHYCPLAKLECAGRKRGRDSTGGMIGAEFTAGACREKGLGEETLGEWPFSSLDS
jgi:hypothetical protein